jgi:polygalacturonase
MKEVKKGNTNRKNWKYSIPVLVLVLILTLATQAFAATNDVKAFGAKGNGVADDTAAIQKALDQGGEVNFPNGTYLIKSNLVIKDGNSLIGKPGLSKILINNSFIKLKSYNPYKEGAIVNEHFAWNFNQETADSFTIYGMTIEHKQTTQAVKSSLLLGNVDGVKIEKCTFIANGKVITNNIDLFLGCKNVTIDGNTFQNITKATEGGCIWVRNMADNPEKSENLTYNITIQNNNFTKKSNDEIIAVFGNFGAVKKVNINNNKFISTGYASDVVLSIFSSTKVNDMASVEDVIFKGNTIKVEDYNAHVLMVGRSTNPTGKVNNITVEDNVFDTKVSLSKYQDVIRVFDFSEIKNVTIKNNKLNNTGRKTIEAGIIGGNLVSANVVKGSFGVTITGTKAA